MQLTFDADVEAFRAEFVRFLDENLPSEAEAAERSRSTSHVPEWARRWQRLQFDHGWLLPGNPPEFGGRNAGILEQFVHREELARRRIYHAFNPQGVGIIAASLLSFGTEEQKQTVGGANSARRDDRVTGHERTGSRFGPRGVDDPRDVRDGDHFVVNGQKVWTSGAHDADVILTFVRTDPDAPKHKGISALLIPTDTPGVECRPFASVYDRDDLDFNEVFFTDVRVPAENLVGPLDGGWRVANGSLGHERTMMWMAFANRLEQLLEDFRPIGAVNRDRYATIAMDYQALRLLGSAALGQAARGERDIPGVSVLKVLGSEAEQNAARHALDAAGVEGLSDPALTAPHNPYAQTFSPRAGSRAISAPMRARSPAARRRYSATSSRSGCWDFPLADMNRASDKEGC